MASHLLAGDNHLRLKQTPPQPRIFPLPPEMYMFNETPACLKIQHFGVPPTHDQATPQSADLGEEESGQLNSGILTDLLARRSEKKERSVHQQQIFLMFWHTDNTSLILKRNGMRLWQYCSRVLYTPRTLIDKNTNILHAFMLGGKDVSYPQLI